MPPLFSPDASVCDSAAVAPVPRAERIRLPYLDGLRGLTALYVVLHHAWQFFSFDAALRPSARWFALFSLLRFGHTAVGVFIVLSGYCLMLPCLRGHEAVLSGGLRAFLMRRARRIIPPYYAAMLLTTVLLIYVSTQTNAKSYYLTTDAHDLNFVNLLTHVFLVHNLFRRWILEINPPFWSVALEWQIYFVFALALLPLWRKTGASITVGSAFVLGCLPLAFGMQFASPWYLGLFALGMAAANVNFGVSAKCKEWEARNYWPAIMASCACVILFAFLANGNEYSFMRIPQDASIGFGVFFLLIECTKNTRVGKSRSMTVTVLTHPVSNFLGRMSYSLYLVHYPFLAVLIVVMSRLHLGNATNFLVAMGVLVPICVGLGYLFYLCCERPFLSSSSKS